MSLFIWIVAGRNFFRNVHRYRVLLFALTLVVMALVVLAGTVIGMSGTVRAKASRYFAGDVVVLGYDGSGRSRIDDADVVQTVVDDSLAAAGIATVTTSVRSTYYEAGNSQLFFAGYYTPQRRLVGVRWDREASVLATFDFIAGNVPQPDDREGILISTAASRRLHAQVGDEIIVSALTQRGRVNTVPVIIRGIFAESSFFGFTSYLHQETLNVLIEEPQHQINEIGVYLAHPRADEQRAAHTIARAMAEQVPTFGVIRDRDENSDASHAQRGKREYGVVTLTAQLQEIDDLVGAISIVATIIMVLFLFIVVIGVSNTYTMIIYERTREVGTMRALGMQRPGVVALFVVETLYLAVTGVMFGVVTGFGVLFALQNILNFTGRNWAALFLVQGRLVWSVSGTVLAAIAAITLVAAVVGSLRAAVRAAAISPVEALRQE